jgi:predicted metal-dependent enzyme (double-stranded beta helix superfamily)
MKTAARLVLYDDILDPKDVFSLIALTSYYNQFYAQTSRAFIRLESLESLTEKDREVKGHLALFDVQVFVTVCVSDIQPGVLGPCHAHLHSAVPR